jgi:hypothetical protein
MRQRVGMRRIDLVESNHIITIPHTNVQAAQYNGRLLAGAYSAGDAASSGNIGINAPKSRSATQTR